ncbi:MAG: branched-chain amino acid ABC transporter permease [Dehalococcoidia bacterium]|jgi:branched-chain amino acid transport system permease protein
MNKFGYIDWRNTWPKIVAGLAIAVFVALPLMTDSDVIFSMLIFSGVWAIAAMGFTLVLRTGQFSLGQAGFMAIGGYASAILAFKLGLPFWPSFLLAGVVAGVIAFLIGMVVLRVGGIYFSIITLALTEVVRIVGTQWEDVTRGVRGIVTSPPPPINLGFTEINFALSSIPYYYFVLLLVAVTGLVFWQIGRTRMGGTFFAMAANQVIAEHQGIHLMRYRVIAFTIAGIFSGFAGSVYASYIQVMTPLIFGLWESIQIMMMSVVGGMSFLVAGPIAGAVLLYALGNQLSRLPVFGIQELLFGAVVVLVLIFLPEGTGVMDLWPRFWRWVHGESEEYEIPGEFAQDDE